MQFDILDPNLPRRHSIRLKPHDYARSATYFVTLCVWQRECLFDEIVAEQMQESEAGKIVLRAWESLPEHFPHLTLQNFVVMPNHFHGLLTLQNATEEAILPGLGQVLRAYKSRTAIGVNRLLERSERPLWQRNYYERVVRNTQELEKAHRYIALNPARWHTDTENPARAQTISASAHP